MPLGSALDEVMRSLNGPDRRRVGGLFGGWDDLVGPAVAAHVRPVRLDGSVLLVEVDDPSWATQVTFLADTLRSRLVTQVDVIVDRVEVRVAGRRKTGRRDTPLVD